MKKLGIYGDSFANNNHGHVGIPELDSKSWMDLLNSKFDVTCYGKPGSSLYYSYQQFLISQKSYQQIIFVITTPGRWPVPFSDDNGNDLHVPSYSSVEHYLKNLVFNTSNKMAKNKPKILALQTYYLHLHNELTQFNSDMSDLMIDKIKEIRPDTIFVTFDQMMQYVDQFHQKLLLQPDAKYSEAFSSFKEKRCICHVSDIINEVISEDAVTALQTGRWIVSTPATRSHQPANYYYKS